jgi:hypothetical protein
MSVVTREILNPNLVIECKIRQEDSSIQYIKKTYSDLIHDINSAKTYLVNERNVQPGQKVLLCEYSLPHFLIWFIACSELGLGFVFVDNMSRTNYESFINKLNAYGRVDHVIVWPYSTLGIKIGTLHSEPIHIGIYGFYMSPLTRPDAHADVMLATADTPLFHIMSDGIPTVTSHNHQYVYNLIKRNVDLYNLAETDVCLHTTNLIEHSTPATYLLPTLNKCVKHYYTTPTDLDTFVQSHNITQTISKHRLFETRETLGPVLVDDECLDDFFGVFTDANNFLTIRKPDSTLSVTNYVFSQSGKKFFQVSKPSTHVINGTEINGAVLTSVVAEYLKATPGEEFDLYHDNFGIYIVVNTNVNLSLLNSFVVNTLLLTEYIINQQTTKPLSFWTKIS